jgi:hypothetical protein
MLADTHMAWIRRRDALILRGLRRGDDWAVDAAMDFTIDVAQMLWLRAPSWIEGWSRE